MDIRTHWRRLEHRKLNDPQIQRELDSHGRAIIGLWRHKDGTGEVRYWYNPDRERPYLVEITGTEIPDKRFKTRSDGGSYNKELMRSPKISETLSVHICGSETADSSECQIQVSEPSQTCHLHSQ